MKERPIIFTDNIPKILDGTKTQTRRVIESKLLMHPRTLTVYKEPDHYEACWISKDNVVHYCNDLLAHCPYGQVGDTLWVRETWATCSIYDETIPSELPKHIDIYYKKEFDGCWDGVGKYRPSIHMPRWASRITLEITGIRVEGLQEINLEDCLAEGVGGGPNLTPKMQFVSLWQELNAKRGYPWESNPWVWVIEFKKLDGHRQE